MESVAGLSRRAAATAASIGPILDFYFRSRYADRRGDPAICDLTFGNPHEFPLPGLVEAIRERAIPHDKDWFAYKTSRRSRRPSWPRPSAASSASPSSRPTSP